MAKLPQSCGAATAVGALGLWDRGASSIKPHSQRHCRQHQEPGLGALCLWQQEEDTSCTGLCTAGRHGAGCGTGHGAGCGTGQGAH